MKKNNGLTALWQRVTALLLGLLLALTAPSSVHAQSNEGFELLKTGNHFAFMRHALAPGFGDPDNFALRDCSTQRNLSQEGIEQARRIGERFKQNGISEAVVYTSQWCRCIDTANELGIGTPEELPIINSFYATPSRGDRQDQQLREWAVKQDLSKPTVLVAHQVNITALTSVFPASGEIIIVRRNGDGTLAVAARIRTD